MKGVMKETGEKTWGHRYGSLEEGIFGRGYATLEEFADLSGLDRSYLAGVVAGTEKVNPETVRRIEKALMEGHPGLAPEKREGGYSCRLEVAWDESQ